MTAVINWFHSIMQKYIVWPTPKPKTDFHRALETAFPVYDPLFPKMKKAHQEAKETSRQEDEHVPDNWMEHLDSVESASMETDAVASAKECTPTSEGGGETAAQENSQMSTSPNAHNLMSAPTTVDSSLYESDNIVLGPGGQWGLQNDRSSFVRNQNRPDESLAPRVPAWSLPTLRQQWEYSEITHHGRKRQKALNRKKKRAMDD